MLQVTLDTSCVVNLLTALERSPLELLRLVRLAMESRVQIGVTDVVDDEVPHGDDPEEVHRRAYIREKLRQFPVASISPARRAERDALAEDFLRVLWPNVADGSRKRGNSLQDCRHLASHRLCGRDIFVTMDKQLARKAQAHADALSVVVVEPAEALAMVEPGLQSPAESGPWDPVVRPAREDDRGAIRALLEPIRDTYDDFDVWLGSALRTKDVWVAQLDEGVGAVAVWSAKTESTVKLATFFVGDDYRGRALGPHLLFHQIRHWIGMGISKVFVTVSSDRLQALTFFVDYGFRIEGVSARRYKSSAVEFVLAKHLFYETVADDQLDAFLGRVGQQLFDLPDHAAVRDARSWFLPPRFGALSAVSDGVVSGFQISRRGDDSQRMSISELEKVVYPARFVLRGRKAYLIPIKPQWADRMMSVPRAQLPLLANCDQLALRTDNTYYSYPRHLEDDLSDAPVLFYITGTDRMVAGFARIVERVIDEPEVLYLRYGRSGIYGLDDIRSHVKPSGRHHGCAMAIRFAWWAPFPTPVGLDEVRAMGLHHPQSIEAIDYADYERLLKAGGVTW